MSPNRDLCLRYEYYCAYRSISNAQQHLEKIFGIRPEIPGTYSGIDESFEVHFFDDFVQSVAQPYTIHKDRWKPVGTKHIRCPYFVEELNAAIFFPGIIVPKYLPFQLTTADELLPNDENLELLRQSGTRPIIVLPGTDIYKQYWGQVNTVYVKSNDDVKEFGPPNRGYFGDVGFDICSVENKTINKGDHANISTGIYIDMPYHVFASIVLRSSMAKRGLLTHQSIIDPGYRDEFKVMIHNFSDIPVQINMGDRIAQILFSYQMPMKMQITNTLSESERGTKGWGSSGR